MERGLGGAREAGAAVARHAAGDALVVWAADRGGYAALPGASDGEGLYVVRASVHVHAHLHLLAYLCTRSSMYVQVYTYTHTDPYTSPSPRTC